LVVDDGIVVTENIFRKVEAGLSPVEAAFADRRDLLAVISTSITLAAVFRRLIFLEGFVGRLFREFGIVIAGAVLISAFGFAVAHTHAQCSHDPEEKETQSVSMK